ncbi:MAG: VWA domain-containing protein [Treponema sp.]|jgi:Ca-activated chloride channel family protein|nr:VWA domain-containing protein [Treponema sp.]
MSIGFERPLLLFAGAVIVSLCFVIARFSKDAFALSVPLGPPGGSPFKPPFNVEFLVKAIRVLDLAGALALFVAAAGPVFISTELVWLNRGADILFVVDISPSMAGIDMNGSSRFDAARRLVRDFAAARPSDAIGLVAVGNEAGLMVPPTVDRSALYSRLETLKIGELGDGTALGLGLGIAALHIRNSTAPRRAVALITDGENNAGAINPETAAAALRDAGASLWVVGVGGGGEVPIDYTDPVTRIRRTGVFDSRFNAATLRAIARSGGGQYIGAPSAEAFSQAFSLIDQGEMIIRRSGVINRTRSFQAPLAAAALALICAARFMRRYILGAFL